MNSLQDKGAVVTSGGTGIARKSAKEGASAVVGGFSPNPVQVVPLSPKKAGHLVRK